MKGEQKWKLKGNRSENEIGTEVKMVLLQVSCHVTGVPSIIFALIPPTKPVEVSRMFFVL